MKLYLGNYSYDFYYYTNNKVVCSYMTDCGNIGINFSESNYDEVLALWNDFCSTLQIIPSRYNIVKLTDDSAVIIFDKIVFVDYSCSALIDDTQKIIDNLKSWENVPSFVFKIQDTSEYLKSNVLPTIFMPNAVYGIRNTFWLSFRKMENPFFLNRQLIVEVLENAIVTPLFYIWKNTDGIGNTVILRGNNEDVEKLGYKTLREALHEEIFWRQVLIPLATEDFDSLTREISSQKPKEDFILYDFNINLHSHTLNRITNLTNEKQLLEETIRVRDRQNIADKIRISKVRKEIEENKDALKSCSSLDKLKDELSKIKNLPFIMEVSFVDTKIVFETAPIQIDDGPILGGYEISYDVVNNHLNIINIVNPKNGCEHPHIQNNHICWGNYSDVEIYFATGEFLVGLEILYRFLSTYNADDEWGCALIYWDAQYAFRNIIDLGNLCEVSSEYDEYYYDIYGEHLPQADVCPDCGEIDCTCNNCSYCGRDMDYCTCWICPDCGCKVGEDCDCERCPSCSELVSDCECERCDDCGGLIDPDNYYSGDNCTCERCPEDYDIFVDPEDVCAQCEEWDCKYNTNEGHASTQDEILF